MNRHASSDQLRFAFRQQTAQAQKNNTVVNLAQPEDQLTKIFVLGDKHSLPIIGATQHYIVRDSWLHLCYVLHVVAFRAKAVDDLSIHAFIG